MASIPASENPICVSIDYTGSDTWEVTMVATSALIGPSRTIPISAVHYSGTGVSTISGSLSTVTPATIATGEFTPQIEYEYLNFFFDNSWAYSVGTYTTSVVITATSL
jgi:hypothetical protein